MMQVLQKHPPIFLNERLLHANGVDLDQVIGDSQLRREPHEPFRWIEMIPANSIPVVSGKGMMIIVIAFAKSKEGKNRIIDGAQFLGIGLRTDRMRDRIDKPGAMMESEKTQQNTGEKRADRMQENTADSKNCQIHDNRQRQIMAVLKHHARIAHQIGNPTFLKILLIRKKPKNMRVPKSFFYRIRVLFGFVVIVMQTLIKCLDLFQL